MAQGEIKVGSVVRLKSGGPAMTVQNITPRGHAGCAWFEGTKQQTGAFILESLELIEADGKGARIV